jgi:chitin synthase
MDDFSWGNTRIVLGEQGQKLVISDEGKFDPRSIPKMTWEAHWTEQLNASEEMRNAWGGNWRSDRSETRSTLAGKFGDDKSDTKSVLGVAAWRDDGSETHSAWGVVWRDEKSEAPGPGYTRSIMSQRKPRPASRLTAAMGGGDFDQSMSYNRPRASYAPSTFSALGTEEPVSVAQMLRAKKAASKLMNGTDGVENGTPVDRSRDSSAPTPFDAPEAEKRASLAQLMRQRKTDAPNLPPAIPEQIQGAPEQPVAVPRESIEPGQPSVDYENLPADSQILREIRDIMSSDGAMRMTKKSVRLELERRLGCNLESRKEFINGAMEALISGLL